MKKPNIVLIFVDDLGIGDVSCYNPHSKIHTENIDTIAEAGLKFTNAHATSALCTPSRYGLLTGRYNWRSTLKKGVFFGSEDNLIEENRLTLAGLLKNRGYNTACIGKWHLGMKWLHTGEGPFDVDYSKPYQLGPNDFGFDYFYGIQCSLCQPPFVFLENDHAVSIPDTFDGDKGHIPLAKNTERTWMYGPAASDYSVNDCVAILQKKALDIIEEFSERDEPFFLYYPTPAVHVPLLPSEEFIGKSGIGYYGDFVLMMDSMVGEITAKLKEKGLEENTIVIFASDNGCASNCGVPEMISKGHNPSYIYRGLKGDIYEGGHRIPYIVKAPGLTEAGSESESMVSLSDILATVADLFGEKLPDNAGEDSVSHLSLWKGERKEVRESICYSSMKGALSIQKGSWKLEMCPGSGGPTDIIEKTDFEGKPEFQLYNMEGDITERYNLISEFPEKSEELKALLKKCILEGRSTPGKPGKNTGIYSEWWEEIDWIRE